MSISVELGREELLCACPSCLGSEGFVFKVPPLSCHGRALHLEDENCLAYSLRQKIS